MKEQVTEIVAAYLRKNTVAPNDVPALIVEVHQILAGLGQPTTPEPESTSRTPAVPIRRSVSNDFIVCLECGVKAKMLRRHLKSAHNMTTDDYRLRWNLPKTYTFVAPVYAVRRSELAKTFGLGKRRRADGS